MNPTRAPGVPQTKTSGISAGVSQNAAAIGALQPMLEQIAIENATRQLETAATGQALADLTARVAVLEGLLGGDGGGPQGGGLLQQIADLVEANARLVATLTASATVGPVAGPGPDPAADREFAPVVEADGGSIAFVVQDGKHATVNGARLLTEDEIAAMIQTAVATALSSVGAALG